LNEGSSISLKFKVLNYKVEFQLISTKGNHYTCGWGDYFGTWFIEYRRNYAQKVG